MNPNWKYVPFEQLFEWCPKSEIGSNDGSKTGKYRLYIASATIIKYCDHSLAKGESLIFGTGGNPSIHYTEDEFAYTNHCETAQKKFKDICTRFYYYYFQQDRMAQLQSTFVGGGIKNSSKKKIGKLLVPQLPLAEQERIVARLENILSNVQAAERELEQAENRLIEFELSVFIQAYEGKLTEAWRKRHSTVNAYNDFLKIKKEQYSFANETNEIKLEIPACWVICHIGEIFDVELGATPRRTCPEYWGGTINWVSSGEVKFKDIVETEEKITEQGLANTSTNIQEPGTVMLAMIGEGKTRGQAALLKTQAAHNQNTAAILVSKTPCMPEFIYYFLKLNYENTRKIGSGNNQKALNKERVRSLKLPFASFDEQKEIVRQIKKQSDTIAQIKNQLITMRVYLAALRQGILREAFSGNL